MTEAGVHIREARPADHQRIGDLTIAAYIDGGHMSSDDGYLEHLRQVSDRAQRAQLLVAEVDGVVAGSVTVTDYDGHYAEVSRPGELEFRMLAVAPEFQGRGVARALVRHIISLAEDRADVTAVTLCSLTSMSTAHLLYQSEGFSPEPSRDFVLITANKNGRFPFFIRSIRADLPPARQLASAERK